MSVVKLTPSTSSEFLEANKDVLVVLVFDAEFTGQGEIINKAVQALSASDDLKGKISIATVDVENNNDLASKFSVLSVPIIVCVKGSEVVRKVDNLEPTKLVSIITEQVKKCELLSQPDDNPKEVLDPKERFSEYLKRLVKKANVMIFMKGHPQAPRCGFSRQLVELLEKYAIDYETFDILQDDEVRQGLKEYSDWPTYPQIYVKGEFVGGLDILKQMEESGEIEATLKA